MPMNNRDARSIHIAEQGHAAMANYAAGLAKAYQAMLREGVPGEHAVLIVCAIASSMAAAAGGGRPEQ